MRDRRPALILYIVAVTLVLIAKIFDVDNLLLVAKPMVVPAIYYYYLQTRRGKLNVLFSIGLLFFFLADMIMMVYNAAGHLVVMFCGIVSYSVIIYFVLRDSTQLKSNAKHLLLLLLLLLIPTVSLLSILNLQVDVIVSNYMIYAIYGFILWFMLAISIYNYISKLDNAFLYLCIATVCLFLSDVFYCVHYYMFRSPVLDNLNLMTQLISYFFMVKYFNLRKRKLVLKSTIV